MNISEIQSSAYVQSRKNYITLHWRIFCSRQTLQMMMVHKVPTGHSATILVVKV